MEQSPQIESNHCLNCTATLSPEDQFCGACGQKRSTGRITIKQLFADFFDNVFNLDSRIFLSIRTLLIPGALTDEYFKGKHKTYLHPFRIFLISLIAMIAAANWALNEGISKEGDLLMRVSRARVEKNIIHEIDSLNTLYGATVEGSLLSNSLDTLKKEVYRRNGIKGDSVDLDNYLTIASEDFDPVYIDDFFLLTADELIEKYKITGWKRKYIFRQKIKVLKDSRSFLRFLIGRMSWMALVLIPLVALLLKFFYWRKEFYYVEHFIFALHTHSVFFILVALQVVLLNWWPPWTLAITSSVVGLYLLLAMRRFYKQSWLWTSIKFILLFLAYQICIFASLVIALLLGIFLF